MPRWRLFVELIIMPSYSAAHIWANVKYLVRVFGRKPLFVPRLARNYIKLAANPNRPPIRFVDVAITYRCNMHCEHCSATEMIQDGRPFLSLDDYRLIAKKLLDAGALVFNFTGGDPFMRDDLYDIITCFQPHKALIAVQTNGLLLTKDRLRDLKRLGVNSINISLDSADPAIHDEFRGTPGAFEHVIQGLQNALAMGFNTGISYTITHDSFGSEDWGRMLELTSDLGTNMFYNLAVPIGFWKGQYDNLLTPEDRKELLKILQKYPHTKTDHESTYIRRGCGAVKEKIYLTAYGDVIPCPFIQVSFGNLLTDEFETIRDRALRYKYFTAYHPVCIAAEDRAFIANTKCYGLDADQMQMPIPYEQAFRDEAEALDSKS